MEHIVVEKGISLFQAAVISVATLCIAAYWRKTNERCYEDGWNDHANYERNHHKN